MGPTQDQQNKPNGLRKGAVTRSQNNSITSKNNKNDNQSKRKAECSPTKEIIVKRSAFGDITNAQGKTAILQDAQYLLKKGNKPAAKPPLKAKDKPAAKVPAAITSRNIVQPTIKTKVTIKKLPVTTRPKLITVQKNEEIGTKIRMPQIKVKEIKELKLSKEETTEASESQQKSLTTNNSSDCSLYVSALEDIPSDNSGSQDESEVVEVAEIKTSSIPDGVIDFDNETLNDQFQVSLYAMDIFNYLKEREIKFKIADYMPKQPSISKWMRALLVDWMVEIQETFELNHETLYLAVKLVDLYLTKVVVGKEKLQLIGATAMFIASKYDERIPPLVEDFLYVCDNAYKHRELIQMESSLLKLVDFDLGIPLSYRFLRRYARCSKLSLQTLTLARYILELSLMEYSFISTSDSKLAAAALLLALKLKVMSGWTPTLQYYSGYKLQDIKDLVYELNTMLQKKPHDALATVRNKYSHKIFFEVAKIPLLDKLVL